MKHSLGFLNEEIKETMETEKGLFSRILKNDYGRGGAWPFYWGVFYPKGVHKNSSNRLGVNITNSHVDIGTGFGFDSNVARKRFNKNCHENLPAVTKLIEEIFSGGSFILTDPDGTTFDNDGIPDDSTQSLTWQEWLKNPEMSKYNVEKIFPKNQILNMSFEELVGEVSKIFNQLFPLILLAIDEDPMPKIYDYLSVPPAKSPST